MVLKDLRTSYNLSQSEAAHFLNVPVRTYRRYEIDDNYGSEIKRNAFIDSLKNKYEITETKGILSIDNIKERVIPIITRKNINYCILFGSYARGEAKEISDVDLLIDTDITGMEFLMLVEEIRTSLHKKVDLLRLKDLRHDNPIVLEILKDGIRLL